MSTTNTLTILYDLPTKIPGIGCWSPNVWKTRLVLNYKQIPYTTHWLLHQDIEPVLAGQGVPPNPQVPSGQLNSKPSAYTVPTVKLPDGQFAMDSAAIAPKLEALKPEPSLHLENGLHEKVLPIIGQIALPLLGVLFPRIGREVIVDEAVPMWKAKREAQFGMSVDELEATRGGEMAWKGAEPGFQALSKFLREHKVNEGPFLLGSQVCYGDFIIAGLLESMKRIGADIYERMVSHDEGLVKLHEACAPWCENDQ